MENTFTCCICKKNFGGFGNNPDGAVWKSGKKIIMPVFSIDDRCCDSCDHMFVIPGRIYRLSLKRKEAK